jgi:hypothetical protein
MTRPLLGAYPQGAGGAGRSPVEFNGSIAMQHRHLRLVWALFALAAIAFIVVPMVLP